MYKYFGDSSSVKIRNDLCVFTQPIDGDGTFKSILYRCILNGRWGVSGKTVETDESKDGKRKHNRGNFVEGLCVFCGVEYETSMIAVYDRRI